MVGEFGAAESPGEGPLSFTVYATRLRLEDKDIVKVTSNHNPPHTHHTLLTPLSPRSVLATHNSLHT